MEKPVWGRTPVPLITMVEEMAQIMMENIGRTVVEMKAPAMVELVVLAHQKTYQAGREPAWRVWQRVDKKFSNISVPSWYYKEQMQKIEM